LTFAIDLTACSQRECQSKTPPATYICQQPFHFNIRKLGCQKRDANVKIAALAKAHESKLFPLAQICGFLTMDWHPIARNRPRWPLWCRALIRAVREDEQE
jgi:hypothetical protein